MDFLDIIKNRLFSKQNFTNYARHRIENKILHIRNLSSEEKWKKDFESNLIKPLVIHFEDITVNERTEWIKGEMFPSDFNVRRGKYYEVPVKRIHFSFTGKKNLFDYTPSRFDYCPPSGGVDEDFLYFDIIMFKGITKEEVSKKIDDFISSVKFYVNGLNKDIEDYNKKYSREVKESFNAVQEDNSSNEKIFEELNIGSHTEKEKDIEPTQNGEKNEIRSVKKKDDFGAYVNIIIENFYQKNYTKKGSIHNEIRTNE